MYRVQDGCSNLPPNIYGYGQLLVVHGAGDTIAQMYFNYNNNDTWVRSGNPLYVGGPDDYLPWELISTATKPQEYSLPLAEGVTALGAGYKNTYSKDQFGFVRVWVGVKFESVPDLYAPVFTLPMGFRPDSQCSSAVVLTYGENYPAAIHIGSDGGTSLDHGTISHTGQINLHGFIEFPAGD